MSEQSNLWLTYFGRRPTNLLPLGAMLMIVLVCSAAAVAADDSEVISRVAFGSCVHQDKPQPIWDAIVATRPEMFLLIGDNIYGDSSDMAVLRAKYAKLGAQPGYQRLLSACPIHATWDDHDYGLNDGGVEFAQKAASQQVFNDFFHVPADSPRRHRAGVYDALLVGPPGKRVQVILLDTRYFRSPLRRWTSGKRNGAGPYLPNEAAEATMLGPAQWAWLEKQLSVPAELRIIASSVQVVAEQHGWEMWANFPRERQRLFQLIRDANADGVLMISGDRHLAEISRLAPTVEGPAYPLFDVTSSSLNVPSGGGNENEVNRHRLGEHYPGVNFGTVSIDWSQSDPQVQMAIHDVAGAIVRRESVALSALKAPTAAP
ncbi:MAG: alkaline phosphatase family protein [Planctomycetales bacterium]|nr:alkaline phosphatase family protein [Planctomycetales bacterium]